MSSTNTDEDKMTSALVEVAVESWRFSRAFLRLAKRLDAGESTRYVNQFRYFRNKIVRALEENDLRIVDLEGQTYDPGAAVSAINIGDFSPDDDLVVDHMVEPIIMDSEGLRRQGTVMLRKVQK